MNRKLSLMLMLVAFGAGSAAINAEESPPHTLKASDQENHLTLSKQVLPEQLGVVAALYPDFRILTLCPGHFSGGSANELVLGIWQPMQSPKSEVHRVGVIWHNQAWQVHVIDDEIERDAKVGSFPQDWQYSFTEKGFSAATKCGVESEFGENSDLTYLMGDKPFFSLKKKGLQKNKVACFATSDVYNNWDCLVYSPKENRFKLWFQQAHAD